MGKKESWRVNEREREKERERDGFPGNFETGKEKIRMIKKIKQLQKSNKSQGDRRVKERKKKDFLKEKVAE